MKLFFPFFSFKKKKMQLFKFSSSLNKRLFISYGTDWVLVIIMIAIFFGVDTIAPYHREFSITDTSLMHEYAVHETIPVWLLGVKYHVLREALTHCVCV
jgi:diacylglycerol diphosphate phosphatase/phosphatidate phosphatase